MAKDGVTVLDVGRACIELQRQRRSIVPTNVRLELGRGSFTTITKHLRTLALLNLRGRKRPTEQHRKSRLKAT